MCGIVGLILTGKQTNTGLWTVADQNACLANLGKIPGVLRDLTLFDTVRGWDATGYMQCDNKWKDDPAVNCFKLNVDGGQFVQHSKVIAMLNSMDKYRFHVVHNRFGTKGGKTSKNAHPFHEKNIWAVHNGGITAINGMKDFNSFAVDSEAATAYMQREGVVEFAKNVIGGYTFVWFDETDYSFHILRNEERPLKMYETKDYIAFGSEGGMVLSALSRNGHKIEKEIEIKAGTHYEFNIYSDKGLVITEEALEMYKAPVHTPKVFQGNHVHQGKFGGKGNEGSHIGSGASYPTTDEVLTGLGLKAKQVFPFIPCNREQYSSEGAWYISSEEVIAGVSCTVKSTSMAHAQTEKFLGEYVTGEIISAYYHGGTKEIHIMVKDLQLMSEEETTAFENSIDPLTDTTVTQTVEEFLSKIAKKPEITVPQSYIGLCNVCGVSVNRSHLRPIPGYMSKMVCEHCVSEATYKEPQIGSVVQGSTYHQQSSAIN